MDPIEEARFEDWLSSFASSFAGHCDDEGIFMAREAWRASKNWLVMVKETDAKYQLSDTKL